MMDALAHTHQATATAHIEGFAAAAPAFPGNGVDWVAALRTDALERFSGDGLPSRRIEEWKFTRLDALASAPFAPARGAADAQVDAAALADFAPEGAAARLVFVNGRLVPGLSDPGAAMDGITVMSLAGALDGSGTSLEGQLASGAGAAESLVALNTAFMADGAVVRIAPGMRPAGAIALIHVATGADQAAHHLRNVILLGEGAQATVIESFIGINDAPSACFTNAVTDIHLEAGAALTHGRIEAEGPEALHVGRACVRIGEGAAYDAFALLTGGQLARQETDARFEGVGGRLRIFGVSLGRGRQHLDITTRIDHAHPGCTTEERVNNVLDDRAHGVFQGLIRVAPGAAKTDARQNNYNLLLSNRAVADTKPELEILADDVKCAHGATVGDLDADALFYLSARGIPEAEARSLLVEGFIAEIAAACEDSDLRAVLDAQVAAWLGVDRTGGAP